MNSEKNFVWFRNDLRLTYNKVIDRASINTNPIFCIFILDPKLTSLKSSARRLLFLYESLIRLDKDLNKLNTKLLIAEGDPSDIWDILSGDDIAHIYCAKDYSTFSARRDSNVEKYLNKNSELIHVKNNVIFDLNDGITNKEGNPFKVFTQFKIQWLNKLRHELDLNKKYLKSINPSEANFASINDVNQLADQLAKNKIKIINAKDLVIDDNSQLFPAGESEATHKWKKFLENKIYDYGKYRNQLDMEGTSQLSPYYKFGNLSIFQVVEDCIEILGSDFNNFRKLQGTKVSGVESYLSEIIWREFYKYILAHFPKVEKGAFQEKYDKIDWEFDEEKFKAWRDGSTGYPVVDACMRQMNAIGWMHNRGRMIVGSFLCKDLHINWQLGEQYFKEKLIDYDLSANNGGWQWVAGVGTDAAPYFRIFNPMEQGERHDPSGEFIRKWIPELKNVPNKFLYSPWEMSIFEQTEYGVAIGKDYPAPIVDHKKAREEALKMYKLDNTNNR